MKILAISGSPRKGNTEFALRTIVKEANRKGAKTELILLRQKNIKHCTGCLYCDKTKKCQINDYMQKMYGKMNKADILIIGTPNYFDNIPGLLKDLIDRTNPYYETDRLKDKRVFIVVVGAGKIKNSEKVIEAINHFIIAHKMVLHKKIILKALHKDELQKNKNTITKLRKFGGDLA